MSSAEINQICHQLAQEGKEPSVALIKGRLSQKLPMPQIIAGFQQWKNNPNQVIAEPMPERQEIEKNLEQRVAELETIVAKLVAKIEL